MSQETPGSGKKNRIPPQAPSLHQPGPGERDAAQVEPDRRSLTLVDGIPGVVWEAYGQPDAAQQRIDFISPAVETMLGYSVREWLDTPNFWLSIVHPDDRARAAAIAADAFTRGDAHTNQFRWLTKDGRTLWVESHSTVVRDEGGAPIGMRGVTLDVTARKQAEEELRQHLEDLSRMQQVSTRLMQAGNFADLLRDILAAAIEITGAHMGNIQLLNGDALRIAVHQGLSDAFLEFFDTVHHHHAACGTALERGERVLVEDVTNSPIFLGTPALDVLLSAGVRAVQSTPLISRSGRTLGMFSTQYRHAPARPSHRALRLLDILARQAADLIETRQADEALRAREAQLHRLISETPFMLTRCSRDLRYTFVSRAYADMLGKTPSDIEGRLMVEIMGDEGFTTIRPQVDAVLSGTRVEYESDVRFAGVGQRSLRVVYVPDRATDGMVIGWIASILDVTQERLTSEARRFLVELDDKVRPLIDPDEITFTAARALGEHLGVNRCAYAAVEEDEDTFLLTGNYNNGVGSIVGRYTFRQFGDECLRLMRAGEPYVVTDSDNDPRVTGSEKPSYEMTAIRAVICVPILKQGQFVAAMAVHSATPRAWEPDQVELVQRVAGRCWESIERARVTRELRESEHRFRALANSIANLAWMARPDGWIYWYNDQWFAYTGTTPADMEGWGWERVHDPAVLPAVKKQWQQSIDSGTPFEMVFPLRGADGHFRRFLTRVNPVRDSRGDVVQWFGTNTDVENERRATEANAELRERERLAREEAELLREAAEAANRTKDEFLAMLGHELRNPLSPILTALQLMKLRGSDASQRERTVIERQVNHLTRLVDDLLDVSRIASGRVELKEEVVEMAAVVAKDGGEPKTLVEGGSDARYVPTGHIVYALRGTLLAVPFDLATLSVGGSVPVIEGVRRSTAQVSGAALYAFSDSGSVVYVPGPVSEQEAVFIYDQQGVGQALPLPPGPYRYPRVSPEGSQVAFDSSDNKEAFVSVYNLSGTTAPTRITFGSNNRYPIWSGEGKHVAFQSDREGAPAVFWQAIGSGSAERLTTAEPGTSHVPESFSRDGVLLYSVRKGTTVSLWSLSIADRQPKAFGEVVSQGLPTNAAFSPDGAWVAYQTGVSDSLEGLTYVQPFPATGTKREIGRGGRPVWSRDGKDLFFVPAPGQFRMVKVTLKPTFSFTSPVAVRRPFGISGPGTPRTFDLLTDGRLIGVGPAAQGPGGAEIRVVLNWFEELKARVGRGR